MFVFTPAQDRKNNQFPVKKLEAIVVYKHVPNHGYIATPPLYLTFTLKQTQPVNVWDGIGYIV